MLKWVGIFICLLQSAMFSGLNLGFFGLSRLRLEVQAATGDQDAARILTLRKDAHFLLATLLWGNVSSNVLLALLSESILAGVGAFLFSTVGITFFGEIIPQAYLARYALTGVYPFFKGSSNFLKSQQKLSAIFHGFPILFFNPFFVK